MPNDILRSSRSRVKDNSFQFVIDAQEVLRVAQVL